MWVDTVLLLGKLGLAAGPLFTVATAIAGLACLLVEMLLPKFLEEEEQSLPLCRCATVGAGI
jgi:hypothetical protein